MSGASGKVLAAIQVTPEALVGGLIGRIRDGNLTLVPLSLYFADGKVKVELALARGKEARDKRQDLARRDAQREITRELGRRAKGMT